MILQVRDAALSLSRKSLVFFHQGDHPTSRFERQWTIPDTYEQLIWLLSQYAVYLISFSFPSYFLYFNTFNTGIGFLHAIHPLTNPAVLNLDQFFSVKALCLECFISVTQSITWVSSSITPFLVWFKILDKSHETPWLSSGSARRYRYWLSCFINQSNCKSRLLLYLHQPNLIYNC